MPSYAAPAPARRLIVVTVLGLLIAAGSAALSIISFISLLMLLTKSHGTQSADLLGFLLVVVAPPLTFVAGIGLALRWRWAWIYCIAALVVVLGWQAREWTRPPQPPVTTYTSPAGVKHTVYNQGPQTSAPLVALCVGLLALLLAPGIRREFGFNSSNTSSPPPGGISRPEPATAVRHSASSESGPAAPVARSPGDSAPTPKWTFRDTMGVLGFFALVLGVAAVSGWMAYHGLEDGRTVMLLPKTSHVATVLRDEEPALFWTVIGTYTAVGLACAGFTVWLATQMWRNRSRHSDSI